MITRSFFPATFSFVLAILLLTIGCGPRLSVNDSIQLAPGDIRSIEIDPISSEQTVKITAKAEHPFHCHIYVKSEAASVDLDIAKDIDPTKALAGTRNATSHTFSAVIPAGVTAAVRFEASSGETATAKYTMSN